MELKFLGRGAALNPCEGSNSAYFIDNNELFLIDCGESTFRNLYERDILKDVNRVNLLVTHTHSDHIGSVGSLQSYLYHVLNKELNIVTSEKSSEKEAKLIEALKSFASFEYNLIDEKDFDNKYQLFSKIRFVETDHCDMLQCNGIMFETKSGIVYYSGDTRSIDDIKKIIDNNKIDKLYIDSCSIDSNDSVHIYIGKLKEIIPTSLKERVYCMHIDNDKCINLAKKYGFNVVEVEQVKKK